MRIFLDCSVIQLIDLTRIDFLTSHQVLPEDPDSEALELSPGLFVRPVFAVLLNAANPRPVTSEPGVATLERVGGRVSAAPGAASPPRYDGAIDFIFIGVSASPLAAHVRKVLRHVAAVFKVSRLSPCAAVLSFLDIPSVLDLVRSVVFAVNGGS